ATRTMITFLKMGATVFVQPLDLVKNRMQLSGQGSKAREYRTSFHALFSILRNEGVRGIYTGLSAGLLRQATYTTTRLGIYTILFEKMTGADGRPPNFILKALIGMTAGATGAFVGTPAEVALIRMTADGRDRWRLSGTKTINTYKPSSVCPGYFGDDILCHFCASMISGLVTTAASMPVDIVKTRIQNMRMIDGKPEYKNGLVSSCTELANQGAGMMSLMLNESEEGVFGRVPVHLYESQSEKGGGFFLFTS
uniref:Solute carrier family 25 member 11 n=1 Tax=Nothobranchius furzeri TaxID=105023 RepID=A0A8C6ME49_NOTFU